MGFSCKRETEKQWRLDFWSLIFTSTMLFDALSFFYFFLSEFIKRACCVHIIKGWNKNGTSLHALLLHIVHALGIGDFCWVMEFKFFLIRFITPWAF